jgi:hypothetical protein
MIYDFNALRACSDFRRRTLPCDVCKGAKKEATDCEHSTYRDAIDLPPEAIRAVIFGTDTSVVDVNDVFSILSDSRYDHVSLFWSSLHSERYDLQYNKSGREYVGFIQKLRTKQIAFAKKHVHHSESGTTLTPAAKGVNYTTAPKPRGNQPNEITKTGA